MGMGEGDDVSDDSESIFNALCLADANGVGGAKGAAMGGGKWVAGSEAEWDVSSDGMVDGGRGGG